MGRITKTLLVKAEGGGDRFCIAVLPATDRVDLNRVTSCAGAGLWKLASERELSDLTDYPRFGATPLGVRGVPVYIDLRLHDWETILVGGGAPGIEVELSPTELSRLTEGTWVALT